MSGAGCTMVSAQESGLAMDGVCEQVIANGTKVAVGQAAFPSGVKSVNSQSCRHAGEYLLGVQELLDSSSVEGSFDKAKL